jgi:hypothetical protein
MKLTLAILFGVTTLCGNSFAAKSPAQKRNPQTKIIFEDKDVPHFVVATQKGKKIVLISRNSLGRGSSGKKSQEGQ